MDNLAKGLGQGPGIYFRINLPFGIHIDITQTVLTILVATILLTVVSVIVSRNIKKRPGGLQVIIEKLVTILYDLVEETMGKHNLIFAPYIGTLMVSSMLCSVLGMTNILRSATADLSVTLAWALVTTIIVWVCSIKNNGFLGWLKGFTEPIFIMTPMNIVSEIAQPLSLAFRHFGNVAGGGVLTALIYNALAVATSFVFGWLPGWLTSILPSWLAEIPFFQIGIPAVLSVYFDIFSGFVQAFVFSLLTMVYVGSANPPPEEVAAAKLEAAEKKAAKKAKRAAKKATA